MNDARPYTVVSHRPPDDGSTNFHCRSRSRFEHLTGQVVKSPYRLGKPLDAPFDDVRTTRRGDYRALYTIDDQMRVVTVLAVAHRRDAYRPS